MRPLANYPTPVGSRVLSVFPHRGPASYTGITPGEPPAVSTDGDTVYASEAGLKTFDTVLGGLSDSGAYRVEVVHDAVSGLIGSTNPGQSVPTRAVRLRWVVVATEAEAGDVDMSAEIVRLTAFGSY